MELIRISDRKLKVMLTPLDMRHFELSNESFGTDAVETSRAFHLLLEEIRRQTGFDTDDRHVSVQYFPSREGGCEMFISNLQSEETQMRHFISASLPAAQQDSESKLPQKRNGGFRKECAYRFDRLTHLLCACKRLCTQDCICESEAFREESGAYILFLKILTSSPFSLPEELDFIVEYGSMENAALMRLYIREHGKSICEQNAVTELAALL